MTRTTTLSLPSIDMTKTELQQVLDVLSSNRVMAKDAAGNYTREVTPKRITDAIALCEASLARAVEPNRFANEPLNYGTCSSLESARDTADEARRLWLLGQYPSACVVLDMQVARLMHATPQAAAQPSQADAQDAARYRWLRSTTNWASNSSNERIDVRNSPELWDAAIDAAIKAKERAAHGIKQGGQHD